MITFEELDAKVKKEFSEEGYTYALKEWEKKKDWLIPHIELVPGPYYIDENGNETCEYIEETCAAFNTYEEELAYFCWLQGCSLYTSFDWVDGSPNFSVVWPATEEEYQENLKEAEAWWKEVSE